MDDAHLKEEGTASELLFEGNFLRARRDTVRLPDGKSATREYVIHPGAVVVVPMLDDGRLVLERQYRYPVGHVMTEFPAGKLDAGEDPLVCGQRELLEETGYTAREWAHAGAMHLAVAYSTEIIHIYFARGLSLGDRQLDHGEFLDVITARPEELMGWCRDGTVSDAKTLTCTLWLQNVLSGAWSLDWQTPLCPTAPDNGHMKVLDLQCAHGHGFEGWFASNEAFDTQLAGGLVDCPICGDTAITKLLSAPRLNLGSVKAPAEPATAVSVDSSPEARWMRAVREVMAKTEDVGERFADEARKMHYGEAEERGIRGQATREETRTLLDEGISVFSLPVPPALKETLQ